MSTLIDNGSNQLHLVRNALVVWRHAILTKSDSFQWKIPITSEPRGRTSFELLLRNGISGIFITSETRDGMKLIDARFNRLISWQQEWSESVDDLSVISFDANNGALYMFAIQIQEKH